MKRSNLTLVSYSSSDEEDIAQEMPPKAPPMKKRKLPPLSSSIVTPGPVDNPALHQGRIRTTPHVDGQFAAHVYVSLPLGRHSLLYKVVQAILCDAKEAIPTLHEIWTTEPVSQRPELHISLSRPIFLRAHQREDLKRAVKNIAKAHKAFIVSFAILSELINDEKTRTFLTMEVGAGHHELRSLANSLAPAIEAVRQQAYYVKPRFHASIAWALPNNRPGTSGPLPVASDGTYGPCATEGIRVPPSNPNSPITGTDVFPTIACFPPEVITTLNERYGSELSSPKVGAFTVESITLKIGKDMISWNLTGM
ncbi:hypothetical protein GALMADRAFT_238043 [Galerina marginata CBS 339.88]|uniref:U6 snRNA phosphodiesterase 1 n=1 Tax=Galerina marginata (strain CBS 339.88) TaxID=685588 RepID=A0A067TJW1_GALM3|nr:hypothetical protein GALMADRAFT_238043 [Galerina marginata CBS 339.88]